MGGERLQPATGQRPAPQAPKVRTRKAKRAETEARQRKSREMGPLKARLKETEAEIARIEARVRDLTDQMADPEIYKDGERAREVARERKGLEGQAGSLYGKWEELAVRIESARDSNRLLSSLDESGFISILQVYNWWLRERQR